MNTKTSKALLRAMVPPAPGSPRRHYFRSTRQAIERGIALALGDALVYTFVDVEKRRLDENSERGLYEEGRRQAPALITSIERLNGMTIDDLYVFAIDRPGKFSPNRQGPFEFGNVLAAEALHVSSHMSGRHLGPRGERLILWSNGAPAFPHRLPNARWRRGKAFSFKDVSTYTLVLEGVQHFSTGGGMEGRSKGTARKAAWLTTPALTKEAAVFARGAPWKLMTVPISKIIFTDYAEAEYEERARDPKSGPAHVRALAELMKKNVPMPPAVGYRDRFNPGFFIAHDGNHRITAASMLGLRYVPMLVYENGAL